MEKKSCCPIGGEPNLFTDYKPKGENFKIKDMDVYTTGKGDKVVIVAHDIFGFEGGRTKLVCD